MPAAALGTLVTDVAPGVVEDVEGFGRQHGEALAHLRHGLDAPSDQPELLAEDLRLAMRAIGRITGRVDVEELLDFVFRDFCIGK